MATGKNVDLKLTIKAFDKVSKPLANINSKLQRLTVPARALGNSFRGLSMQLGLPRVGSALRGVGRSFQGVGRSVMGLGKMIAGMVAGALFGGYGLFALVKGAVTAGDTLAKISDRLGLSIDSYAQLQYAAAKASVGQEEFNASMDRFSKNLGDLKAGTGPLFTLLSKVSPAFLRQLKSAKSTEQGFYLVTKAMHRLTQASQQSSLAAAAFGRSGMKMVNLLKGGTAALDKERKEFARTAGSQKRYALESQETANTLTFLGAAFEGLRSATAPLQPAFRQLATTLANFIAQNRGKLAAWAEKTGKAITGWVNGGGLERLAKSFKEIAGKVGHLVDKLGGPKGLLVLFAGMKLAPLIASVASLGGAFVKLGAALAPVAIRMGALAFAPLATAAGTFFGAISAGTPVMAAFDAVLDANPIGAVIVAIGLLGTAAFLIYKRWKPIKAFFKGIWAELKSDFVAGWNYLKPYLEKIEAFALKFTGLGSALKVFKAVRGWFHSGSPAAPASPPARPSLGAAGVAAGLPARGGGRNVTHIKVDFSNAPRGTRVTHKTNADAPVDLSMGYSLVAP